MAAKLTLYVDPRAVHKARRFADRSKNSLSKLVERYFNSLADASRGKAGEIGPIVRSLCGVLKNKGDAREAYGSYLAAKYKV